MPHEKLLIIAQDIATIQKNLIQNPKKYITTLLNAVNTSPKLFTNLTSYILDLSLAYIKQIYEDCFPETSQGGFLKEKSALRNGKYKSDRMTPINLPFSERLHTRFIRSNISIKMRPIILILFQDCRTLSRIPSFVHLLVIKTTKSKRTVYRYIQRGESILHQTVDANLIIAYRNGNVTPTQYYQQMSSKKGG
jgi:hypothetical protein